LNFRVYRTPADSLVASYHNKCSAIRTEVAYIIDPRENRDAVPVLSWYTARYLMEAQNELAKSSDISVRELYQKVCTVNNIQKDFPLLNFGLSMMLAYGIFVFPKEVLGNSVDWSKCEFSPEDTFNFLIDETGAQKRLPQFIRGMRNAISHANVKYLGGVPADQENGCTFWSEKKEEASKTMVVNFKVQTSSKGFLEFLDKVGKFLINEVLLPRYRTREQ